MKIININLSFVCKKFTFCSLTVLLYWRILINKESKWFPTNTFHNVRYINIVYTITFRNVWQKNIAYTNTFHNVRQRNIVKTFVYTRVFLLGDNYDTKWHVLHD